MSSTAKTLEKPQKANWGADVRLCRWPDGWMQTLIRVVHTLRAMGDYSTPEKRHDMLIAELTGAFFSTDKSTVI